MRNIKATSGAIVVIVGESVGDVEATSGAIVVVVPTQQEASIALGSALAERKRQNDKMIELATRERIT